MTFKLPQNPQGDWVSIVDRQKAENHALEEKHIAERLAVMSDEITTQTAYFSHLGWLGRSFRDAFNKAAAPVNVDIHTVHCRAVLSTHNIYNGFMREITLGRSIVMDTNPFAIFGALTHEGTHLFNQYDRVPASHATPYNTRSPVVLCPRDAVILNILLERQAFAMELLMDDLLAEARDFKGDVFEVPPAADLQVKLQEYARMQNTRTRWDSEVAFLDNYRCGRMNDYEEAGRVEYLKQNNITYVRLGLSDLRILNECLGMKTFGETDDDLLKMLDSRFTPEQQARLDRINENLGIENEDRLPVLEEALVQRGISPEDFLKTGSSRFIFLPPPDGNVPVAAKPAPV